MYVKGFISNATGAWVIVTLLSIVGQSTTRAGLVAYYPLDGNTMDKSGDGNDGVIKGDATPNWTGGIFGQALELDGRNDYVDVPTFKMTTNSATFAAWIKGWKPVDWAGIDIDMGGIVLTDAGNRVGICFGRDDALHYRWDNHSLAWDLGPTIPKNEWAMVAVTIGSDGGTAYVYTNRRGLQKANNSTSHSSWMIQGLKIGWADRPADNPAMFHGCIDEVAVFDDRLSDDEVEQLARLGGQSFVLSSPLLMWTKAVAEAERMLGEISGSELLSSVAKKITAYEQWKAANSTIEGFPYELILADLRLVLANAKGVAGASQSEVSDAYVKAIYLSEKRLARRSALDWLLKNLPPEELRGILKNVLLTSKDIKYTCQSISRRLVSKGDWPTFELFMNTAFENAKDVVAAAGGMEEGLSEHGKWQEKFGDYCRNEPRLTDYSIEKQVASAKQYEANGQFKEASEIYGNILSKSEKMIKRAEVEFAACKSLFSSQEYKMAIVKIDEFISKYRMTHRKLITQALATKGQCLVRLGEIDNARSVFLLLATEYPEVPVAPESVYLVGYGCMMQRRFEEAKDAFGILLSDYAESGYAQKARDYIDRIDSMTSTLSVK